MGKGIGHVVNMSEVLDGLAGAFEKLANVAGASLEEVIRDVGALVASMNLLDQSLDAFRRGFGVLRAGNITGGLAQMGTGVAGAASAFLQATSSKSGALRTLGGAATGAQIGMTFGPVGGVVGGIVGGIAGLFRGLGAEEKKVNDLRDEFIRAAGGLAELNERASEAGATLDALLGARTETALQRAIGDLEARFEALGEAVQRYGLTWEDMTADRRVKELDAQVRQLADDMMMLQRAGYDHDAVLRKQADSYGELVLAAARVGSEVPPALGPALKQLHEMGLLSEQVQRALLGVAEEAAVDWRAMQEVAEKYGIELDSLGPRFQAAKLGEQAAQVAAEWKLLTEGGADVAAVMAGMDETVTKMIQDAITYGIELPASMKPIVEAMQKAGEFTDENGEKLEDLSRLEFAKPIEDQFKLVADAIDRLIEKLVSLSATSATPTVRLRYETVEMPAGEVPAFEYMHRGGPVGASYWAAGAGLAHAHQGLYLAPDEVPLIAQRGEGVVSADVGMPTLYKWALNALNRGEFAGGEGRPINLTIELDSDVIARKMLRAQDAALRIQGF